MPLSIVLGFILMASVGGAYFYITLQKAQIDQLQVELQTAVNNQQVLESTISQQNSQLEQQLAQQRENQARITELTEANDEARQEATELRNTFARHDLNNLSIRKPGLIEKIVNKSTKGVGDELAQITDPAR